jgi:hypothetical protein
MRFFESLAIQRLESKCVIRITTSAWSDKRGLNVKKCLSYLRRKTTGYYNIMEEDCQQIGDREVLDRIINLYSVEDGVYEVIPCDEYRDWESGYIEDYNYKLVPYKEGV